MIASSISSRKASYFISVYTACTFIIRKYEVDSVLYTSIEACPCYPSREFVIKSDVCDDHFVRSYKFQHSDMSLICYPNPKFTRHSWPISMRIWASLWIPVPLNCFDAFLRYFDYSCFRLVVNFSNSSSLPSAVGAYSWRNNENK